MRDNSRAFNFGFDLTIQVCDVTIIFQVTGYPTIIYFEDGVEKYNAGSAFKRTAEGIVEYIKE